MEIVPVRPTGSEARAIMDQLDRELLTFYPHTQVHGIDAPEFERGGGYFVLAREDAVIGCGAFRPLERGCAEIKRMFVSPEARRRGVARKILRHLEGEIRRRGLLSIVLETGVEQHAAMGLYASEGYFAIPPFLEYVGCPISRCYAKKV
jgi:putative acetyltransferase